MDRQRQGRADHEGDGDMVMSRSIAAGLIALACFAGAAHAAGTEDIMGAWQRDDGIARVKVAPCGRVICMTNTFIKPGTPDEKVGERLEFDVKASGGSSLAGTVRDPKTGKSYTATIDVSADTMTTRGCVMGGVICKGQSWTRLRER